jgi:hypothetical protein
MNNKHLIENWHKSIIDECVIRIGRELTDTESEFIQSREAFIALEVIEDTVNSMSKEELIQYLNSESA